MQKADKFVWPMSWNSRNGYAFLDEVQSGGLHLGFDFNWGYGDQDLGRDVVATASGMVLTSKNVGAGLGETIILLHELPDGTKICSRYGHLKSRWISEGQEILINQGLAQCGKSGGTQYAHLHFELFTYEFYEKYLKGKEGYYPFKWTREHILQYFFDPEKFINEHQNPQVSEPNYEQKAKQLDGFVARWIQEYKLSTSCDLAEIEAEMAKLLPLEDRVNKLREAIEDCVGSFNNDSALLEALHAVKNDKEKLSDQLADCQLKLSTRKILYAFNVGKFTIKIYKDEKKGS